MMKDIAILFLILLCFSIQVSAQNPESESPFPGLEPGDLREMEILRSDTYDGTSLWGYINGGADVYLEYGFIGLRVQEISRNGTALKADIYVMEDQASAMGIYSVSTFRCAEKMENFPLNCLNPYQLQFVKGKHYVSIQNMDGSPEAIAFMKEMARQLESKLDEGPATHPFDLLSTDQSTLRWWYAEGQLGIQNGIPSWSPYMEGIENFSLLILRPEQGSGWVALLEGVTEEGFEQWKENYLDSGNNAETLIWESAGGKAWLMADFGSDSSEAQKIYTNLKETINQ